MTGPIEAIEARIRVSLQDTEAWRVYADWLLDQGDARGELIMLELLPGAAKDRQLRSAIAALTREHRSSWEPAALPMQAHYEWRHGFVHAVTVREIGRPEDIRSLGRLLADPQARLLSALNLELRGSRGNKFFKPLAELELGKLSWFRARDLERGDNLVHALAQQSTLALIGLDLRWAGISDAGLIELAGWAGLRGLRSLRLTHNAIGPRGVSALAKAATLSELEELDLRHNAIGAAGAEALAKSPFLGRLTALNLYAHEIDNAGVAALASSVSLPRDLVRFWQAQRNREPA